MCCIIALSAPKNSWPQTPKPDSTSNRFAGQLSYSFFLTGDEEIRPQIASVRGVKPNDVMVNVMGDLRILRGAIVHNAGILSAPDYAKLLVMKDLCEPDQKLAPTHDQMHKLFVFVKQAIGALILEYSGHLPGAPSPAEITDVAIERRRR